MFRKIAPSFQTNGSVNFICGNGVSILFKNITRLHTQGMIFQFGSSYPSAITLYNSHQVQIADSFFFKIIQGRYQEQYILFTLLSWLSTVPFVEPEEPVVVELCCHVSVLLVSIIAFLRETQELLVER